MLLMTVFLLVCAIIFSQSLSCVIVLISLIVSPEGSVNVTTSSNVVTRGENVTLVCSAMGGPEISYIWMTNGVTVGNERTQVVVNIDASLGGSYTCIASNAAGNVSASITLYVAPYIVISLDEEILTASGSNVNISCNATGFPIPTVNWVDVRSMKISHGPLLEFSPIMFEDEGPYRCVAAAEINGMNFTATDETILVGMHIMYMVNMMQCDPFQSLYSFSRIQRCCIKYYLKQRKQRHFPMLYNGIRRI